MIKPPPSVPVTVTADHKTCFERGNWQWSPARPGDTPRTCSSAVLSIFCVGRLELCVAFLNKSHVEANPKSVGLTTNFTPGHPLPCVPQAHKMWEPQGSRIPELLPLAGWLHCRRILVFRGLLGEPFVFILMQLCIFYQGPKSCADECCTLRGHVLFGLALIANKVITEIKVGVTSSMP